MTKHLSDKHREHRRKKSTISLLLLAVWFFTTFIPLYFARDLTFVFFGWPFSFWVAAQGALIVYILIIWFYARYVNKLDEEISSEEGN